MTNEELIGKCVINRDGERGIVVGIDDQKRIEIQYETRLATYIPDAFYKGFVKFTADEDNQKIKLEWLAKNKDKLSLRLERYLSELNELVGLSNIKETVRDLTCQIKVAKLRDAYGLKVPEITKHMVFSGNPGTGKTTVARIIAKIYNALGVLSKGQLVEVDRSCLVAGFQGQTAMKTKDVVKSALGGVLFIDEAYSLCRDDDDDFGLEALDTLTKEIEDHRDDLVVIVAGYKKEMKKFLNSNPGLKSRFKTFINFDDYSGDELYQILKNFLKSNDYSLSKSADEKVLEFFHKHDSLQGNGRTVRNVFEEIIRYQSRRLDALSEVSKRMLVTIKSEDLKGLHSMAM